MKIDAKIKWVSGDVDTGITYYDIEKIAVDTDMVKSEFNDIINSVESALADKYGKFYYYEQDFWIENLDELKEEIAFSEFKNKVDP